MSSATVVGSVAVTPERTGAWLGTPKVSVVVVTKPFWSSVVSVNVSVRETWDVTV
ncbi:hypothetical protein [Bradyrhizobium sp. 6(2017)]|uniref:hypothetical protein n=1 Tax=Bradyrhizobium sp. 6(2017) TaxID=1197460 RepID=UPI002FE60439